MAAEASGVSSPCDPGPSPTTNNVPALRGSALIASAYQDEREVGQVLPEGVLEVQEDSFVGPADLLHERRAGEPAAEAELLDEPGQEVDGLQPADRSAPVEDRADLVGVVGGRADGEDVVLLGQWPP